VHLALTVPTFEDKVLQRAVVMVLEPLYEQDFLDCSYGFRPGRSAHEAQRTLWEKLMRMGGGYLIDLDIRKFFDTMSHEHLREILKARVCDGVLTRLVGKWLKAGVWERGSVAYSKEGSPQGGVISPMLSNIYLHEVLDKWFYEEVRPRMRGEAHLIRFADDAVLAFREERDAQRVLEVLSKRFGRYGLTVHSEKTKLVRFTRPEGPKGSGGKRPQTFNFRVPNNCQLGGQKVNWVNLNIVPGSPNGISLSNGLGRSMVASSSNKAEY